MENWIRIDTSFPRNPKVYAIAFKLKIKKSHALGLITATLLAMGEHAKDGDLSEVSDMAIEEWAGWDGEPGAYAAAFKEEYVVNGVVPGWLDRQGKLIERAEAEAKRVAERRAEKSKKTEDSPRTVPEQSADSSQLRNVTVRNKDQLLAAASAAEPKPVRPAKAAEPKEKAAKSTWLTPYYDAYRAARGEKSVVPVGPITKTLKKLHDEHGLDETLAQFQAYLGTTEVQYENWYKFGSGFGSWGSAAPAGMTREEARQWEVYQQMTGGI